ncbi:hypothetical protein [Marinobacter bohaiensis]|nr:hypothetical protein [Marinobacter bohaiensis]
MRLRFPVRAIAGKRLGTIIADNLKVAHAEPDPGRMVGKAVLEGFQVLVF